MGGAGKGWSQKGSGKGKSSKGWGSDKGWGSGSDDWSWGKGGKGSWTDDDRNTFLPMRLGYATTLLKVQGATLAHMTIWLDVPNVEAAGYVALSRVRKDWRQR